MATPFLITLYVLVVTGCNGVLGNDGCDTCNERYRHINGLFTRPDLDYGYNYITTIPRSACNITISQLKSSSNHLALRQSDGTYFLNGDWNINQPGQYTSCGTTFRYHRDLNHNLMTEYIQAAGPLNEPIQIMLLAIQVNSGIKYEYDIPISDGLPINPDSATTAAFQSRNTFTQHRVHYGRNDTTTSYTIEESSVGRRHYRNKHFTWKTCYKSCGDGIYRHSVCLHHSNERIVSDIHCSTLEKPAQENYRCNVTKKCLPEWVVSEWSPCSASCGEGFQTREVVCKQFSSTGYPITVHIEACVSSPPLTKQKCHVKDCGTAVAIVESWEMGPWSECSSSCGSGIRTRKVTCNLSSCSPIDIPPSKEPCHSVCRTDVGTWLTSEWNLECSESCGSGWQMRNVICYGGGQCNKTEHPATYRACQSNETCSGQWFEGPWQKCNGICRYGEQRRNVVCIAKLNNQFVVVPDQNCKLDNKPITAQRCPLPECSPAWYMTNWSMCSRPCGGGFQYREVFCIKDNTESSQCPANEKPSTTQHCNTNSCISLVKDNGCEDKHKYCQTAVQARLCQYNYYKTLCCQACYNKI